VDSQYVVRKWRALSGQQTSELKAAGPGGISLHARLVYIKMGVTSCGSSNSKSCLNCVYEGISALEPTATAM